MLLLRRTTKRSAIATAALFVIAGCAGESASGIPYATPGLAALNEISLERAGARSFLYVTDSGTDNVQVYGWPKPENPVATLTGFNEPQGACADMSGDVFIVNTGDRNILEYKGGGTSPIQTLGDPAGFPVGCSVDPTSDNLAVTDILNNSYGQGNIAIYTDATGTPKVITSKELFQPYFDQYDGSGNLFITGVGSTDAPVFAELPAHSKHIKTPCGPGLMGGDSFPGSIAWDGKHIVIAGTSAGRWGAIRLSGCKKVGFTPLTGDSDIVQFSIAGNRLIGPDAGNADVEIFSYPKGGAPVTTLTGFSEPIGAAVTSSTKKTP
jgi:hypothetical protein